LLIDISVWYCRWKWGRDRFVCCCYCWEITPHLIFIFLLTHSFEIMIISKNLIKEKQQNKLIIF